MAVRAVSVVPLFFWNAAVDIIVIAMDWAISSICLAVLERGC
jgi:hypothetical protein